MAYADMLRKHRRLAILRFLADCADYTSNVSIIADVLDGVGLPSTRDQVITELVWMQENGFVKIEDFGSFVVAEALGRGVEIAKGRAQHPEIQRPSARQG